MRLAMTEFVVIYRDWIKHCYRMHSAVSFCSLFWTELFCYTKEVPEKWVMSCMVSVIWSIVTHDHEINIILTQMH